MQVLGTYYIGTIEITCDCGEEQCYCVNENEEFYEEEIDGKRYDNVWTCPNCGKKIDVNCFIDDSVCEEIDYEELEDNENND